MGKNAMLEIIARRKNGEKIGIYSACSANSYVIEAVMESALEHNQYALIEATANQVNQFGGYTGMKPDDFINFVYTIAEKTSFPKEKIIFGGDHLGPLVWQNLPESEAMPLAEELIKLYVLSGFTKIHVDTSMMVSDDDKNIRLSDEIIAKRAARLAKVAERGYKERLTSNPDAIEPVYVIGSEVPVPGGAQENDEEVLVTKPQQFADTYNTFKEIFNKEGLQDAFQRVIGVVVQPGVEFSDLTVTEYNRDNAKDLCKKRLEYPNIVFEGHSTDYQTKSALKEMVEDGIAILKVGPALTYALRQSLFSLSCIEKEMVAVSSSTSNFREVLEAVMLKNPGYWEKYYYGTESEQAFKRKYSFSDRCRYYLSEGEIVKAVNELINNIDNGELPIALLEQYMPLQYERVRAGKLPLKAEELMKDRIKDYINDYIFAVKG